MFEHRYEEKEEKEYNTKNDFQSDSSFLSLEVEITEP